VRCVQTFKEQKMLQNLIETFTIISQGKLRHFNFPLRMRKRTLIVFCFVNVIVIFNLDDSVRSNSFLDKLYGFFL